MKLLTTKEIAKKTGLGWSTVKKHAKDCPGSVKVGRDWMFKNHVITWDFFNLIKPKRRME